jgi:hypothetical protein
MKNYKILLSLTILILASMACQNTSSGDNTSIESNPQDGIEAEPSNSYNGEWPIPEGAYAINELGRNLHFLVDMSHDEVVDFYLTEMRARGYSDIPISSDYDGADGYTSIWFDGHESGRRIIVSSNERDGNSVEVVIGFVVGD